MNDYFVWNSYYIHKRILGSGSCSKVYYGIHKIKNKEVAIKKISFDQLSDVMKARTIKEINILQSINHPNVIKLYDYKFDKNKLFLITEYCNLGDLSEWIKKDKTPNEILIVIKQILDGINYLHENRIIHRDIKPQNILIQEPLIVKICDFGFSQNFKEEINMFKTICGTPLYMAPEIINMQPYSVKTEIWSLGILFYNIFFNIHPYGHIENMSDYREKLQNEPPLININIFDNNDCNILFTQIIKSMLSLEPENRPDVIDIIRQIKNFESVQNNNQFEFDEEYLKIDIINEYNKKSIVLETIKFDSSPPINSFFNSPPFQPSETKNENIEVFKLDNNLEKGIFNNYFSPETTLKPLLPPISPPYNLPSSSQFFEPLKTIFNMMSSSISKF